MKNRALFGLLVALALCGCQVKEDGEFASEGKVFTATMEAMVDDGAAIETKTSMDASGNVRWKRGDQVSIFVGSTINQHFQVTDESDGKTAASLNPVESSGFVAGGEISNNVAFYPYGATAEIAKNGNSYVISDVALPATQNYAESSFGNGAFPMTAVTSSIRDYNLKFKNVLGGLKLQLKGTAIIASISVTGNSNEVLCGAAEVTVSGENAPSISLTDDSAKTVTLDCGDGVQLDANTATAFIIALPPMTMTGGFTVIVTDAEGASMEIKTTKSQAITRSNLLAMPALTYERTNVPVNNVELNTDNLSLAVGETETLTATITPSDATQSTVVWSSSDSSIAEVDESGKVTAKSVGAVTITATADGKSATCTVTVNPVLVATIELSDTSVNVGSAVTLNPTVKPDNAANKSVTWSSNNTAVATVSTSGVVTGVKAGTATITATAKDGSGVSGSCTVTVNNVAVTSVTLNKTSLSLTNGTSETLTATVSPTNATDKTVTWTSNTTSVATVDANGKVTAVGVGTATITATSGGKSATCAVTVTPILVSSITLSNASVNVGATVTLTPTVKPDNAANKSVNWSSSNTAVATVSTSGVVTGVKAGTATITATAKDGSGISGSCTVTVNNVSVTSVTLNKTSLSLVNGTSETLTATVNPSNATDKTVTWTSNATSVATVDASGKVTAVGVGNATITASSGGKSATCTVTVTPILVNNISLSNSSVYVGSTITLSPTVKPDNAANKAVAWSSNNTAVATVNTSGVVTGVKAGTATITATAKDGSGITGSCTVTVNNVSVTSVTLNKTSLSLVNGTSETLTATVNPSNATNKTVTWSSNATSVATVDASGKVTAVGIGTATITASSGSKSAACAVTVTPVLVNNISLSNRSVYVGSTITMSPTVKPDNAANKAVTWSSNNTSVATVNTSGVVTGVKAGTATITATAKDGSGVSGSCTVTVNNVAVTSVTLNKSSLSLASGASETLIATVNPSNATNKTVTWSSNATSVATVDANGKVTAVGGGTATITATADNKTATCSVSVTITVPVSGVSLKGSNTMNKDAETWLYEIISPNNATNQNVIWMSTNPSVATVNSIGRVTAVSAGQTIITVTTVDGNKKATHEITVYDIDAIDLGLPSGLKWGSMNLGAASSYDYGDYFAWAEVSPKTSFSESDYSMKDYYGYKGTGHMNKVLVHDAASVYLAGGTSLARWRIPTKEEMEELRTSCTWTWTTNNGKNGCLVTGPNGNSIFLPATGYYQSSDLYHRGAEGTYWSATVYDKGSEWKQAWGLTFNSSGVSPLINYRYWSGSIRPVR